MMLLSLVAVLAAHEGGFDVATVSALGESPNEIWAIVGDRGVVWSRDGGANWSWACPQGLGGARTYDVLALEPEIGVVATENGPVRVDLSAGTANLWPGFPSDAVASDQLAKTDQGFLVGAIGSEWAPFVQCDMAGCRPTSMVDPQLHPKSIQRSSGGWYATTARLETLEGALWWSADGETWRLRHEWPAGDVDVRVVAAEPEALLLWLIPREDDGVGRLIRSTDGGESFTEVIVADAWASVNAAVAVTPEAWVWSDGLIETRVSYDHGLTWTDQTDSLPRILCSDKLGDQGLLCADHLADGFDLATSPDGWTWTPIACLEEASLATWATAACADRVDAWTLAALGGGGRCDQVINPVSAAPKNGFAGCAGCAGDGSAGFALLVGAAGLGARARARRRCARQAPTRLRAPSTTQEAQ